MNSRWKRLLLASLALNTLTMSLACGPGPSDSSTKVTTVLSTPSKRQSIGNCWVYAQASWLETLLYKSQNKELNVSESYWTYWDWYTKITDKPTKLPGEYITGEDGKKVFEMDTGGGWIEAKNIIQKYGFLYEDEFAPEEAALEMSARQANAETQIIEALMKGGELSSADKRRDLAHVIKVLNRIFKVDIDALKAKGQANLKTEVAVGKKLELKAPLSKALSYWREVKFDMADGIHDPKKISAKIQTRRKNTLQRAMKALNDGQPVLMSFQVYFDALKIDTQNRMGIFDYETLMNFRETYEIDPSQVGGHMVMLQDYAVRNAPGIGDVGFGNMSDDVKSKAALGELTMFKAKNSWGMTREERGLYDGTSVFEVNYLTMPVDQGEPDEPYHTSNLWSFLIPEYP